MKRACASLSNANKTRNEIKSSMLIDCIELERRIFPALHVTLGPANRLLKDVIDCSDLVVEDTPEELKAQTDRGGTQPCDNQTGDNRLGKAEWSDSC
jgi:hypothetical protein